jgi:crossover junction endodeoxyribonuclease RusA
MLNIFLPYPPSVNTYWGFKGSQRFLTAKARKFKLDVFAAFALSEHESFGKARLQVTVFLYPPDKRIRDIDNVIKPLLDALTQAKVFDDDSQVDRLLVVRKEKKIGGGCRILVENAEPL